MHSCRGSMTAGASTQVGITMLPCAHTLVISTGFLPSQDTLPTCNCSAAIWGHEWRNSKL